MILKNLNFKIKIIVILFIIIFLYYNSLYFIQRKSNGLNYLKRFPNAFKCNNNYKHWSKYSKHDTNYNYSRAAPKELHSLRITRAVAVLFPTEKFHHYIYEIKWLYLSWVNMMKFEPSKWRTDLIIFIDKSEQHFDESVLILKELNCLFDNIRKSPIDKPMCTLIDYQAFIKRKIHPLDLNESINSTYKFLLEKVDILGKNMTEFEKFYKLMKREINNYYFLDSILIGFEG